MQSLRILHFFKNLLGYNLILVARNRKALKELADSLPTKCMIITCDLASEDSCRTLADKLKKYNIRILINNAGFGDFGIFLSIDDMHTYDLAALQR